MKKDKYEIRQWVKTVKCTRMEVVAESIIPRLAKMEYARIVKENPDEYFELIKIIPAQEECLHHTIDRSGEDDTQL